MSLLKKLFEDSQKHVNEVVSCQSLENTGSMKNRVKKRRENLILRKDGECKMKKELVRNQNDGRICLNIP